MTDKPTEATIAALKEAAEKATPGPWFENLEWVMVNSPETSRNADVCLVSSVSLHGSGQKNRRYIALANPSTILALIAEREALREALKPRPIEDAPEDGTRILGICEQWSAPLTVRWHGESWKQLYEWPELKHQPTHFIPLSALATLGE